jgi:hypothetical protein
VVVFFLSFCASGPDLIGKWREVGPDVGGRWV